MFLALFEVRYCTIFTAYQIAFYGFYAYSPHLINQIHKIVIKRTVDR